jgi:hypothetical protein
LARIRQLYKIETAAEEFSAEDRRAQRQIPWSSPPTRRSVAAVINSMDGRSTTAALKTTSLVR